MLVTAISALGVRTILEAMAEVGGGHRGIVVVETMVLLGAALAVVMSTDIAGGFRRRRGLFAARPRVGDQWMLTAIPSSLDSASG